MFWFKNIEIYISIYQNKVTTVLAENLKLY